MARSGKEKPGRLSTVHSSEVVHAQANLNVVVELSPGEALTTRKCPKYPDAQGLERRELLQAYRKPWPKIFTR